MSVGPRQLLWKSLKIGQNTLHVRPIRRRLLPAVFHDLQELLFRRVDLPFVWNRRSSPTHYGRCGLIVVHVSVRACSRHDLMVQHQRLNKLDSCESKHLPHTLSFRRNTHLMRVPETVQFEDRSLQATTFREPSRSRTLRMQS